ncbi:MAG: Rrf2 family transcriptional regulator [Cyanobacteria bacterium]|nr:Rrf2 family transcriptional regulator [Cyanobacteriota bacterium]
MISQTTEYALRAAVFLAMNRHKAFSVYEIAVVTKVPAAYLSKVLQSLAKADIVHSQRGAGGGFILAIAPEHISILDVVNAVDPINRIKTCPLDLKSHGTVLCALHSRLDGACAAIEKAFADTTLSELLEKPTASIPLYDGL